MKPSAYVITLIALLIASTIGYNVGYDNATSKVTLKFQKEKHDKLSEKLKVDYSEIKVTDNWMDAEQVATMWNDSFANCKDNKSEICIRLKASLLELKMTIQQNNSTQD